MTLRFKTLIVLCIIAYIALSLYHWRQLKKIPGPSSKEIVRSVLKKGDQEKNWVQVSTSAEQQLEKTLQIDTSTGSQDTEQSVQESKTLITATETATISSQQKDSDNAPQKAGQEASQDEEQHLQTLSAKDNELHQSQEIDRLRNQLDSLQAKLDATSMLLQEKNQQLKLLKDTRSPQAAESSQQDQDAATIQLLRQTLSKRLAALDKANKRIVGLAEILDQTRQSLYETENAHEHLQKVLSDTEGAKIKAQEEVKRLTLELSQSQQQKNKYLADTGSLYAQLQQVKNRLTFYESELNKAWIKTEAIMRFGEEQKELITPFRQQIEILNARLADQGSALLDTEEQILQYKEQELALHQHKEKLQLQEQKNQKVYQELQKTTDALKKEQIYSAELTDQLKELANQLNNRDAKIVELQQQVEGNERKFQETLQHSNQLNEEIAVLQRGSVKLEEQLTLSKSTIQESAAALVEVQNTNKELAKTIEQQEMQLADASTKSTDLTAQLTQKDRILAEKEAALQKLQMELNQFEHTMEQNSKEAVQADIAQLEETNKKLQSALEAAETSQANADQEIQQLKTALAESKQENEALIIQHTTEREKQNKVIVDTKTKLEKIQKELVELEEKKRLLEQKLVSMDKETSNAEALRQTLKSKTKELEENQNRLNSMGLKLSELQAELDRRETAYFGMQEEFSSLQDNYDTLQKERDSLIRYTLDSDNDSVPDAKDACPDTEQGIEVTPDGCEPDKDGDTIVDRLDLCPESPGLTNLNPLGCTSGQPMILTGIYFSGGNTELSPAAQAYLHKVIAILQNIADKDFEVSGHTDNIGEPQRNQTVSRKRAEAVRNFLIANGIDADRLTAVGYGSEKPIADNATTQGRAANRRVELKIIIPSEPAPGYQEDSISSEAGETTDLPSQ